VQDDNQTAILNMDSVAKLKWYNSKKRKMRRYKHAKVTEERREKIKKEKKKKDLSKRSHSWKKK
jgi:hypothetical protein